MAIGEVLKITKFLNFTEISDSGATKVIGVGNNKGEKLAYIKWMVGWRRYVLLPFNDITFDAQCLSEIVDFINELMEERKNNNGLRKIRQSE